jgi:flagellar basal-body rod protein FlgB
MKLFDATLGRLERSLDVRLQRHGLLAGNVANVDTPGFKPKDVDFTSAMAYIGAGDNPATNVTVEGSDPNHLQVGQPAGGGAGGAVAVVEEPGGTPGLDGNRVDLDRTMMAMAENGLQYGASSRAAQKKLGILRYVVTEGGG